MLFNLASMPDTLQTIHNIFELQNILIIQDRKSTRLNSSHQIISYAVFCLKKKITRLNSSHQIISYAVFCLKNTCFCNARLHTSLYLCRKCIPAVSASSTISYPAFCESLL